MVHGKRSALLTLGLAAALGLTGMYAPWSATILGGPPATRELPQAKLDPVFEALMQNFGKLGLSAEELEKIHSRLCEIKLANGTNKEREEQLKNHPAFKAVLAELREKFAYRSLEDRLAFEKATRKAPARLDKSATDKLTALEADLNGYMGRRRNGALALLHNQEVARFVATEGLGVERTRVLPRLPSEVTKSLALPTLANGQPLTPAERGTPVALPTEAGSAGGTQLMPARNELWNMHLRSALGFLDSRRFGLSKERRVVAGFEPHALDHVPNLLTTATKKVDKEQWLVRQLELVSLLKHEKPAVYATTELPRMNKLAKVPTRPLTEFETRALEALTKGEDVFADATTNSIHMLGSIRATKQCLSCHDCERGALLGAFSYRLERNPPVK